MAGSVIYFSNSLKEDIPMASSQRSKVRLYAEYIPFYLFYRLIHALPLRAGYALSGAMFRLFFVLDWRHRRRAVDHLLHARVCRTRPEAVKLARKSFREFSKLLVEVVKMDQLYDPAKIRVSGPPEALARFVAKDGRPAPENCLIVTAHYGNWEVAGTAYAEKAGRNMVSIMRPFNNPLVGKLILDHRRSAVHELVTKEQGVRPLLKALREGRIATLLIDQHATHAEGVATVFFGQPCRTHKTPALLHLKTGVPILPELTRRVGDNFDFELVFGEPIRFTPTEDKERDVAAICQLCTTALEKMIAEQPEQWLWSHRRWLNINRERKHRTQTDATAEQS